MPLWIRQWDLTHNQCDNDCLFTCLFSNMKMKSNRVVFHPAGFGSAGKPRLNRVRRRAPRPEVQLTTTTTPTPTTQSYTTSSSDSTTGPSPGCDRAIEGDRGRFTSPDYPAKTSQYSRCRITITTARGFVPVMVFHEFEFMGSGDCDSVEAYVQVRYLCSQSNRFPFTTF